MTDRVDRGTRSRIMASVKGKDTGPEMAVRRYLHSLGYRFRLHVKTLPGKPDLVLKKHNLVIFVHGCFWHRHPGCFYATSPVSSKAFWKEKFDTNLARDHRNVSELLARGWRVLVIWGCGIKHDKDQFDEITRLILSDRRYAEWPEKPPRKRGVQISDRGGSGPK